MTNWRHEHDCEVCRATVVCTDPVCLSGVRGSPNRKKVFLCIEHKNYTANEARAASRPRRKGRFI